METALQIFQKWRDYYEGSNISNFEEKLKETQNIIADFSIGFAKWLVNRYEKDIIYDEYTTQELLEIYKNLKNYDTKRKSSNTL